MGWATKYDHLWPISWLDGGFMFFQLSIFTWPGLLGAWRCFKDVHICCRLLCSNLAINVSPSYQTHACPWHLQNKKYGYCSATRHMKSSGHIFFCLQNPHVVYVNPHVCRKACIFTLNISMFLNCKGDGSPHEVMVESPFFTRFTYPFLW